MPEAPIHEDGDPRSSEDDVRVDAGAAGANKEVDAKAKSSSVEYRPQTCFTRAAGTPVRDTDRRRSR
jgi:hypothetical protein